MRPALFESSRPHQPGNINNASSAKWELRETTQQHWVFLFTLYSLYFVFIPISARCELSQNWDLFIPVLSNIIVWFRREENTCKHFLAVNREIECQLGKQQDGQDTKLMHCEKTNPAFYGSSIQAILVIWMIYAVLQRLCLWPFYGLCVVVH